MTPTEERATILKAAITSAVFGLLFLGVLVGAVMAIAEVMR